MRIPEPILTRWELIHLGPYRVFFPLGILCALLGVGHWALWSVGWIKESAGFFHASIQVQGFLTCFVAGFLMTALPRFLGTFPAKTWEIAGTWIALFLFAALALSGRWFAAEMCYLTVIPSLVVFGVRRFPHRTKNPPASFLLIGFGLLQAVLGTAMMLWSGFGSVHPAAMEIGRQMLQLGYMLCLVLGIAGYLTPFLTGFASDPGCDPSVSPFRGTGWRGLGLHSLTGALILSSFFLDPIAPRGAAIGRAVVILVHFCLFGRIYRGVRKSAAYVYFFYAACWMIIVGSAWVALLPDQRLAGLHIIFIGGFSLMIFSFGTMVVLSHSAQASLLNGPLIPLKVVGIAVLAAMVFRGVADVDVWRYRIWIHAASGTWLLAATLWLIYLLPKLWALPVPQPAGQDRAHHPRSPSAA